MNYSLDFSVEKAILRESESTCAYAKLYLYLSLLCGLNVPRLRHALGRGGGGNMSFVTLAPQQKLVAELLQSKGLF